MASAIRLASVNSLCAEDESLALVPSITPHCTVNGWYWERFSCRRLPLLLQSCLLAVLPHVSHLPTLGLTQTPVHPYRHTPSALQRTNKTATPAPPFFNSVAVARCPCATTSLSSFQSFRSSPSLISRGSWN